MTRLKFFLLGVLFGFQLLVGLIRYAVTKKTSTSAHQGMIFLFCRTSGRSSDFLSWIISKFKRQYEIPHQEGLLHLKTRKAVSIAAESLRTKGFYIFEERLPTDLCDRLLEFAMKSPCTTRPMDGESSSKMIITKYDRKNPVAVRYDFNASDLVRNPDIQRILADLSLISVAQEYLQTKPLIDVVSLWWHTAFTDKPDSEAAQFFHFDMDRPKWLKFFIYLTDVTSTSGAHFYVAGSHKSGGIPSALLSKGYSRLSDEEVAAHYPAEDIMEFAAPRGTIIAEDTRGLHKGKHVEYGDRLMFQIQFSNSLFGAKYEKTQFQFPVDAELERNISQYSDIYSAYL